METWSDVRAELEAGIREALSSRTAQQLAGLSDQTREQLREDARYLRRMVVAHRAPRIAVVGKTNVGLRHILESFGSDAIDWSVREALSHGRWYDHVTRGGTLRLADLREEGSPCLRPLHYEQPDLLLAVARSDDEAVDSVAEVLLAALEKADDTWGVYPPAIVTVYREDGGRNAGDFKTIQAFKDAFVHRGLSRDFVDVVAASRAEKLAQTIIAESPDEIRLSLVRMTDDRTAKTELAEEIVRVAASLTGAIATIPIPMADIVPITTTQITMVAGIAYVSGRSIDARSIGEFLAAMGLNVGAGMALRSMVRAAARLIPVAGPLVSASVAAAATKTLGKAAVRHYIR